MHFVDPCQLPAFVQLRGVHFQLVQLAAQLVQMDVSLVERLLQLVPL